MNKKLLAIAIAGVLAAPLAQAQTANVTLYGRINIDAEVIINAKSGSTIITTGTTTLPGDPPPGTKQNLYRVSSNSSRFGVRGTESLGGGLNAIFQIESNVSADSSGGQFATRETFAGLQGGWGTFKLGYFLTPYDDIQAIFGSVPTLQTGILGSQGLWANGGAAPEAGGFDARVGNSLRYDSPNLAGFTGSVQIGARDGNNTNPIPSAALVSAPTALSGDPTSVSGTLPQMRRHAYILSTGGQYNNGPFSAGLTYEVHNNVRLGTIANPHLQDQAGTVAASWNFGIIKIGGAYEQVKYDVAHRRRPEAQLLGDQRHRQPRAWPVLHRLLQGERRQRLVAVRDQRRRHHDVPAHRRRDARSGFGRATVGSELHLSAVEAHAALHRLHDDRQRCQRRLQLRRQRDRRRVHGQFARTQRQHGLRRCGEAARLCHGHGPLLLRRLAQVARLAGPQIETGACGCPFFLALHRFAGGTVVVRGAARAAGCGLRCRQASRQARDAACDGRSTHIWTSPVVKRSLVRQMGRGLLPYIRPLNCGDAAGPDGIC